MWILFYIFNIRLQLDTEDNDFTPVTFSDANLTNGIGSSDPSGLMSDQTPNIIMDTPVPEINVAPHLAMGTTGVELQTLQPMAAYGTEGIFQISNEWYIP